MSPDTTPEQARENRMRAAQHAMIAWYKVCNSLSVILADLDDEQFDALMSVERTFASGEANGTEVNGQQITEAHQTACRAIIDHLTFARQAVLNDRMRRHN